MAAKKFYVIITDEGEPSRVEEISNLADLKARVKQLFTERDKLTGRQAHVVFGELWKVTAGPFPYLVPPHGQANDQHIPLFDAPKPGPVDDEGFLGKSDLDLDPQYAKVTKTLLPAKVKAAENVDSDSPFDS